MPVPQFLLDLLQMLLDLAVPAAFLTLTAAGVSLRHEGGTNFHVNGRTGKWVLWTVVLLTLPQLLSWVAAQGITVPSGSGSVGTSWLASMETVPDMELGQCRRIDRGQHPQPAEIADDKGVRGGRDGRTRRYVFLQNPPACGGFDRDEIGVVRLTRWCVGFDPKNLFHVGLLTMHVVVGLTGRTLGIHQLLLRGLDLRDRFSLQCVEPLTALVVLLGQSLGGLKAHIPVGHRSCY